MVNLPGVKSSSFIIAYIIAQVFGDIFQRIAVKSLWDLTVDKCYIKYPNLIISMGSVNVTTDVIMLALPMSLLWQLQLSMARKRLLRGLFMMGGVVFIPFIRNIQMRADRACIVSIVQVFYDGKVGNNNHLC